MRPLTDAQIRASFINASLRERKGVVLPAAFDEIAWGVREFLGWRDPKQPTLGYLVAELDGRPVGLLMRQTDARPRSRPQCSWCADVTLPNDVVFWSTRRAGDAGRRGDTVGTLVCEEFQCSRNVRQLPPLAYQGYDREAARDRRIEALSSHVEGFVRDVQGGR